MGARAVGRERHFPQGANVSDTDQAAPAKPARAEHITKAQFESRLAKAIEEAQDRFRDDVHVLREAFEDATAHIDVPGAGRPLAAKLAAAQMAITLERDRHVDVDNKEGRRLYGYDYVTEGAICNAIRRELVSQRVAVLPSYVAEEKVGTLTKVTVRIAFIDADSGEREEVQGYGYGTDAADKGLGKAETSALRITLCKAFLQSGDLDPEDSYVEHSAIAGVADSTSGTPTAPLSDPQIVWSTLKNLSTYDEKRAGELAKALGIASIKEADASTITLLQSFIGWLSDQPVDEAENVGVVEMGKRWREVAGTVA
jgi:hypothetical protein